MAYTIKKEKWRDSVLTLLQETLQSAPDFDAAAFVRNGVRSGKMELWNVNGNSHAITQTMGDCMRVHSYSGQDVDKFADVFKQIAKRSGCNRATFHTTQPGLIKKLEKYAPREIGPNEYEVTL